MLQAKNNVLNILIPSINKFSVFVENLKYACIIVLKNIYGGLVMNENYDNANIEDLNADSLVNIGAAYYNGTDGLEQDFEKAFKFYKLAAKMGNVIAMSNLGYCYLYGRSVPVDEDKALYCFEKASEAGDVNATYKIGDFYMWGKGKIEIDKVKAVQYYDKAYEMGADSSRTDNFDCFNFPDVCFRLANCYFYGTVKEKDFEKALNLYTMAKNGFEARIEMGDTFTDDLYAKACAGITKCLTQLNK